MPIIIIIIINIIKITPHSFMPLFAIIICSISLLLFLTLVVVVAIK